MILKGGLIFLSLYNFLPICCGMDMENLEAFMELTALAYEDACNESAETQWMLINDPTNRKLLLDWEEVQAKYSSMKKTESTQIHNQTNIDTDNELLRYKLSVAVKPGDMMLNETDWKKLVSFSARAAILRTGANHTNKNVTHSRREIELLLSGNEKLEDKQAAWSSWHRQLSPLLETYSPTLQLVSKAAKANDVDDVSNYWELLSGYTEGYEKIKIMWEEISKLHKKLVTFVQNRLALKHKITLSGTDIPAYLLGSLDGNDWTFISDEVMPYGNVTYHIMKSLWNKNLRGRTVYKSASTMENSILKNVPEPLFWDNSKFNQSCSTQLINFCRDGATRVLTCHQASISNFLTAHKIVAKVTTNQMKAESSPFLNMANRYSALDEGISELFSILSVSPGQLEALNLIDNSTATDESKISSLMITALDVLPRLAYYISADIWRIDVIKNGTFAPNQLLESWWQYRKQYEHVTSDTSDIPSFLDDDYITSNKPYLAKFVGTILAFKIYEHLTESTEVRYDTATKYANEHVSDIMSMLNEGGGDDWMKVIEKELLIYEISESSLISFFAPLEEFLDNYPEDIYPLTDTQQNDLDRLEELYGSSDVTTTHAPTTTTTTTTSVPMLVPKVPEQLPKQTNTSLPISPPIVPAVKPSNDINKPVKPNGFFEETDEMADTANTYPDKMSTSKAVWAVAVVLVATVTICIIAIFGRRRCVKSQMPKNRRYV